MVNRSETGEAPDGCHLVNQWLTQDRLGKDRLGKDRLDQDRLLTEDARARARETAPNAAENPGENQIEFEKKKRKAIELLLNNEHFQNTRASPERKHPVQRAVNFL